MKYEILKQYGNDACQLVGEQLIHAAKLESAVAVFAAASSEIRAERPCGKVILFDHKQEMNLVTRQPEWIRVPILGYEKGRVIDERKG
jgi:hypothetical protein